jgi:hypothetical protein
LTTAYTVPAAKHGAVQIIAANTGAGAATVRVAHSPSGAAINVKHYVLYDYSLAVGAAQATAKIAVKATDVIRVYASTADVAFNVNGIEDDD